SASLGPNPARQNSRSIIAAVSRSTFFFFFFLRRAACSPFMCDFPLLAGGPSVVRPAASWPYLERDRAGARPPSNQGVAAQPDLVDAGPAERRGELERDRDAAGAQRRCERARQRRLTEHRLGLRD